MNQAHRRIRLAVRALIAFTALAALGVGVSGCLTANLPPVASFAAGQLTGTVPLIVTFDARTSVDADGTILSYHWTFGDGKTAVGDQVAHMFTSPGEYVVTLTITDDDGAKHSVSKTITGIEAPPPSDGGGTCG